MERHCTAAWTVHESTATSGLLLGGLLTGSSTPGADLTSHPLSTLDWWTAMLRSVPVVCCGRNAFVDPRDSQPASSAHAHMLLCVNSTSSL